MNHEYFLSTNNFSYVKWLRAIGEYVILNIETSAMIKVMKMVSVPYLWY